MIDAKIAEEVKQLQGKIAEDAKRFQEKAAEETRRIKAQLYEVEGVLGAEQLKSQRLRDRLLETTKKLQDQQLLRLKLEEAVKQRNEDAGAQP